MFVAGPYIGTYGGLALGVVQNGFELELTTFAERVIGDNLGDSKQDGVYRGQDGFLNAILEEYDLQGVRNAFAPYGALGAIGQVGRMQSDVASQLVLTVIAGTRAALAAAGPATLTAVKSILPENYPIRMLLASRLRSIPLRFQLLPNIGAGQYTPYAQSGNELLFSTT